MGFCYISVPDADLKKFIKWAAHENTNHISVQKNLLFCTW